MNNQRGFSLIELVFVVLIAGFIVLLVSNLPNSIGLIGQGKFASIAKDIASQEIEDARSQGYDNLADGTIQVSDYRLSSLPSGQVSRDVSDCPSSVCKNGELMKQVTATVNWQDSGKPKSVQITTLISKGGLK